MTHQCLTKAFAIGVVLGSLCSSGCVSYRDPLRGAFPVQPDSFGDYVENVVYLDQGWTPQDSLRFYTTTQGSRFIPYRWFLALEQPNGRLPFRSTAFVRQFRFLPETSSRPNPEGLPVGFVRDGRSDWLGFTCSACHTNQVNYKGTGIRVDGAPTLADFDLFQRTITEAIRNTHQDDQKFERFAIAVLGGAFTPASKEDLRTSVAAYLEKQVAYQKRNFSSTPYGYSRVDAFGRIYNTVLDHVDAGPHNSNPPDAPVSYPFLWDTPMHDYVQWVGVAPNANVGSLGRNVGEALGVFAEFSIEEPFFPEIGYRSSVAGKNLVELEERIRKLESPRWPEKILPPIDGILQAQGERLYRDHCISCHRLIDRSDPKRTVRAQMFKLPLIGTDPKTAENIVKYAGRTGVLDGVKQTVYTGSTFGPEANVSAMVSNAVVGVLEHEAFDTALAEVISIAQDRGGEASIKQGDYYPDTPQNPNASLLAYKARPLNGIWATAPYLHNGSVPNLYELLLAPEQRSKSFWVGRREFDPVKVGFLDKGYVPGFGSELDTSLPGNSNSGHDYATTLNKSDRMALLEYLKSL